jgi:FkbM family methyltransferase
VIRKLNLPLHPICVKRSDSLGKDLAVLDCVGKINQDVWYFLDSDIGKPLYYEGGFEMDEMHLLRKIIKPKDVVIDIGANVGIHSLFMANLAYDGEIFSIEPFDKNFALLEKNTSVAKNGNIKTFNIGLADKEETKEMNIFEDYAYNSFVNPERKKLIGTRKIHVETLDIFARKNNIKKIDLIKLDTEGYEFPIIQGASSILSSPDKPLIVMEINKENIKPLHLTQKKVIDFVESFGYQAKMIGKTVRDIDLSEIDHPGSKTENFLFVPKGRVLDL